MSEILDSIKKEVNDKLVQNVTQMETKVLSNQQVNIKESDETTNSLVYKKISELNVSILDNTEDMLTNFQFYHEKHYTNYVSTNMNKQGGYDDMCIRIHTNKLVLLTLAIGNDIMLSDKKIVYIDFTVNNSDRSKVNLKGKKKHGAKKVHTDTIICKVRLEGEEEMRSIRAGVNGYLIEINELVKNNPNLLKTDPSCYGYLAIVMTSISIHKDIDVFRTNPHLISMEKYLELLGSRKVSAT